MSVRVLLADDHPIVRQGLMNLLNSEPDFNVVGEASDGISALENIELTHPDVLVVDMMMPGLNGLEVIRRAKHSHPELRIIVLSMQNIDTYVVEALKLGASGYLLKDTGPAELIQAVKEVVAGRSFISPSISLRLKNLSDETTSTKVNDPYLKLTNREREILHLAAEGFTNAEIAARLSISARTAELHRAHCMSKLGLQNQSDLIHYALKRGVISMDS
jgi:two-component system, NarL family, response regulator NreC